MVGLKWRLSGDASRSAERRSCHVLSDFSVTAELVAFSTSPALLGLAEPSSMLSLYLLQPALFRGAMFNDPSMLLKSSQRVQQHIDRTLLQACLDQLASETNSQVDQRTARRILAGDRGGDWT